MKPEMIVIAGPSGRGKSRHFCVRSFGVSSFNVDDRCAELSGGSYRAIPIEVRAQAQQECEQFVGRCTAQGTSFAVETTLRAAGFVVKMIFVATDDVQSNVLRVARRGLDGGHSAPAERILDIYQRSLANLAQAIAVFDEVLLYDSTAHDTQPRLVRVYHEQGIVFDEPLIPAWLAAALGGG